MTHVPAGARSAWFVRFRPPPAPRLRLFVLSHAGGGAAQFRPWAEVLAPRVELCAVLLPGRETRLREPPLTGHKEVVRQLAAEVQPLLDRPFAVMGHSMGAMLAFELARELRRRGAPMPRKLYLSGRRSPAIPPAPEDPVLHRLPDPELLEAVRHRYGGIPQAILNEPELLQLILPALRADFTILESYTFEPEPPLECPFLVLGGREDTRVPVAHLEAWRELTRGGFELRLFPGGHFYLHDKGSTFLAELAADLARVA